jgi:PAS domain S-box-containing protein
VQITKRCPKCDGDKLYLQTIDAPGLHDAVLVSDVVSPWLKGDKWFACVCGKCGFSEFFLPAEIYQSLTDDVLDSSMVGIFILDATFKVVWVNRALRHYFDLDSENVIGQDKRQLIRERIRPILEDPETFTEKIFATYENNTYIENFECHVFPGCKCGEHWLEYWSQPIRTGFYAGGRIEHYYDITSRKQAEKALQQAQRKEAIEALQQSEERYRSLFEHSPISLWEEDFSAVKTYLDHLRAEKGIQNFRAYFESHPKTITECAVMVKVVDVNQASVELFQAESKEKLLGSLSQIFVKGSHHAFEEELIAIAENKTEFEDINISRPLRSRTLKGDTKYTTLKWSVAPGYEETFSKVLVSIVDITAYKHAEAEKAGLLQAVEQQHQQLRALTKQLAETQEIERKQLAQELHDQVGQKLTALDFNLNRIRTRLSAAFPGTDLTRALLDDSLILVKQIAESIRDVMASLRPPLLDDYGLVAALQWYTTQFASRVGFTMTVYGEEPAPRLIAPVEHALFRITQEVLTNVAKHAQATQVEVMIGMDNSVARLVITDDGVGFEPKQLTGPTGRQGWGLITITERAEAVSGRCLIESQPGQGTRIIVEVPR